MVPTHNGSTSDGLAPQHQPEAWPAIWRLNQQSQEIVSLEAQAWNRFSSSVPTGLGGFSSISIFRFFPSFIVIYFKSFFYRLILFLCPVFLLNLPSLGWEVFHQRHDLLRLISFPTGLSCFHWSSGFPPQSPNGLGGFLPGYTHTYTYTLNGALV